LNPNQKNNILTEISENTMRANVTAGKRTDCFTQYRQDVCWYLVFATMLTARRVLVAYARTLNKYQK